MEDECVEELGRPISSMKVTELRDELTRRALTKTGNKKELIDRLRTAIQRQSSLSTSQPVAIDQSGQLNQQQFQQNVPQYIAAAALQQNQVAAAYQQQLNQIQPQAQLNAYSIPANQPQQYPQTMMQPLDLQHQIPDQSQAIHSASEFQQQQQNTSGQQPIEDSADTIQPPIDMRVAQQPSISQEEEKLTSIDLSSSAKDASKQPQKSDKSESDEQISDQADNESAIEERTSQLEQQAKVVEEEAEKPACEEQTKQVVDAPEKHEDVSHNDEAATEKSPKEVIESDPAKTAQETSQKELVDDSLSTDKTAVEPQVELSSSSHIEQETAADKIGQTIDTLEPPEKESKGLNEGESQSTFSLKRGISELRSSQSGNKEKRRKWSSKGGGDACPTKDSSQATIMIGGISSQKLQELIEEKSTESDVKSSKQASAEQLDVNSALPAEDNENGEEEMREDVEESQPMDESAEKSTEKTQDTSQTDPDIERESETIAKLQVEPTNVILVQNLVRPFTITQLKEVLTKHGPIVDDKFWTDKVKSKCCVVYESIEVAQSTKESLNGQQWPSSNPKTLKVSYITEETLVKFQKSELSKSNESVSENGNPPGDQISKSITNRLGERVDDVDGSSGSELVKKRLGEKVSGEVSTKSSSVNRDANNSKPQELDDLFKKTKAVPHLFWLPLNEEEAESRREARIERENRVKEQAQKQARSPPRRRFSPRHRSPPGRRNVRRRSPVDRRSPPRHRSPPSRRTSPPPPRRSSPTRRRSPVTRNPPPRRRSPMLPRRSPSSSSLSPIPSRRSPGMVRRSPNINRRSPPRPVRHHPPGPVHRSPGPIRRSPGLLHGSPAPIRRSPGLIRRSPGLIRRSPRPNRRSPGLIRRSPAPIRRSPGLMRRSPGLMRRSPGLIRRSPAPIRGSSPTRRSSPGRRSPARRRSRSPARYTPPGRNLGYPSDQRRFQRLDRSR